MSKTILLTGVTGFIAKRIALDLLNAGYTVRGSRRSDGRDDEVRDALRPHLTDKDALDRLSFVSLDLTEDAGWDAAMEGVDVLVHTASPFPGGEPKDEMELIRPAVDGALRALKAAQAKGVTRVVLTSSMVAVMYKDLSDGQRITPEDWSDLDHASVGAYAKSKTLAEKAAWDFVKEHPEMQLSTINPGLVMGPPVDRNYGTSLEVVEQIMSGAFPRVPDVAIPAVDLRDVSAAHIRAFEVEGAVGKRFLLAEDHVKMLEIAKAIKEAVPSSKAPTKLAPNFLVSLLALFNQQMRQLKPTLGIKARIDNSRTRDLLGIDFIASEEAAKASARAIEEFKAA